LNTPDSIPVPHLLDPEPASRFDYRVLAPAKINLFLHVTGRLENGYHELQTVFQFVGLHDELGFRLCDASEISLDTTYDEVVAEDNLVLRAARALQSASGYPGGCELSLEKSIPSGAGLGGGSSDAAATLVVLNHLWDTRFSLSQLQHLAVELGADVPVFVAGHACWAEGIGENFDYFSPPEDWFLLVYPGVRVATAEVFGATELTRNCSPITIRDFVAGAGENVCEPVVLERFPQVRAVQELLLSSIERLQPRYTRSSTTGLRVRMTGTGSCLFVSCENREQALKLYEAFKEISAEAGLPGAQSQVTEADRLKVPTGIEAFVVPGQNRSSLYR